MNIIILDTNIVFSAILNPRSKIGEILFNNREILKFYSSEYLREEIDRHRSKILKISKSTEGDINETIYQIYKQINFISDEQIPLDIWYQYAPIVEDIDIDDLPFVALTAYLDGLLWTGDLKLKNGLNAKGFQKCITTKELLDTIIQ